MAVFWMGVVRVATQPQRVQVADIFWPRRVRPYLGATGCKLPQNKPKERIIYCDVQNRVFITKGRTTLAGHVTGGVHRNHLRNQHMIVLGGLVTGHDLSV